MSFRSSFLLRDTHMFPERSSVWRPSRCARMFRNWRRHFGCLCRVHHRTKMAGRIRRRLRRNMRRCCRRRSSSRVAACPRMETRTTRRRSPLGRMRTCVRTIRSLRHHSRCWCIGRRRRLAQADRYTFRRSTSRRGRSSGNMSRSVERRS